MFRNCLRIFQLIAALSLIGAALTACSTRTYKADVVQGNFVSSEQVDALRAGMPKTQVRNILGTPLLTDLFHADRWDYVFTIERAGVSAKPRRLTTYFKGEILDRWEGDPMPSEAEFVKSLDSGRKIGKIPALVASERELADFAAAQNKSRQSGSSAALTPNDSAGAAKTYPPLEAQ